MEKDILVRENTTESRLFIDKTLGLSYCMDSEDMYKEILKVYIEQIEEYLPQLETAFTNCDWQQYAIITHAIKSNSKNIGAVNFAEYSLQHENAGKEADAGYILVEYEEYVRLLKRLMETVEGLYS